MFVQAKARHSHSKGKKYESKENYDLSGLEIIKLKLIFCLMFSPSDLYCYLLDILGTCVFSSWQWVY